MKNLKLGISALALTVAATVSAQTTSNPWLIGVGAHGVNHLAVERKAQDLVGTAFLSKTLYSVNNFTITPPLSKLVIARNLSKFLVVDWQTSVGNVDNKRESMGKEFFLQTGLGVQLKIAGMLGNEEFWLDPYVRVGAGYLRHDYTQTGVLSPTGKTIGANHFNVPVGFGINVWFTKSIGLGIQQDYVRTLGGGSYIPSFYQTSASLNFRFGNRDKDKDGILDEDDLCPEIPGLPEFQGCPDKDGDGVPDKDDNCPEIAGPVENNGCPWPDTDDDGVLDKDDACVDVPGPAENNGCPWPDTDDDGVLDKDDECPLVPGLPEYKGCPKPQTVFAEEVTTTLEDILFNFNKSSIRPESNAKLDQAAEIIKSSNGGMFLVVGHADIMGDPNYNLKLSKERAASVVAALEARGVDSSQLKSKGVGSTEAMLTASASNKERMKDRKVVVQAISASDWEAIKKSDIPVVDKKTEKKRRK